MSSIATKLCAVMAIDPGRAEIEFEGCEHTWGDLRRCVDHIAGAASAMTLPKDGRLGVLLRNRPGHIAAILAAISTDRCLVSLNPMQPDGKLTREMERLDAAAVVADEEDIHRPGLREALERAGCGIVVVDARLSGVRILQERTTQEIHRSRGVAIEMLTSGTTGAPKRVPLSRVALESALTDATRYERRRGPDDEPRLRSGVTMVVNPLTHIGGIFGCIGALASGRKITLLEKFTVEGWVSAVKRHRLKVAPSVPSVVRMLLDADIAPDDLSSLTAIICGTAPLVPELVEAFHSKYGVPVLCNYGATEFAGAVAGWGVGDFRTHWKAKRGAVGRVNPNVAARVVDAVTGERLPSGEEGLLELKGDQIGGPHALHGRSWLRTTDRAVLDDDNFLFIKGRADNAIVRGGFKVHPDDVASVLNQHAAVREAAVVGVPDQRLGEVPAAAVILRDGAATPDPDELKAWLRERLIAYQVPVHILIVDDFPRTPSMKPSAPDLAALFAS